jgi:putative FmdB family regulatory protein
MTYEYMCNECHYEWEESQRINEEALTECPKCHKESAQRLISNGTGFILKGGGWAREGYSSK